MVNENRMVECRSAGENQQHAENSRPPVPRFNNSTSITPQLQPSHPSPPLGLGLVEYSVPHFSPLPGKSKIGKCAIVRRGAASFRLLEALSCGISRFPLVLRAIGQRFRKGWHFLFRLLWFFGSLTFIYLPSPLRPPNMRFPGATAPSPRRVWPIIKSNSRSLKARWIC